MNSLPSMGKTTHLVSNEYSDRHVRTREGPIPIISDISTIEEFILGKIDDEGLQPQNVCSIKNVPVIKVTQLGILDKVHMCII